jgi:predicted PurR-regulated permease PerM
VNGRSRTWQRRRVRLTPTTVVLIIGTAALAVLARDLFHAAHRVIGWAAAAVVVAALLDLPIGLLARRIGRVAAVALTFLAVAAAALALVYGVFDNLRTEAERFQKAAPEAAAQLEARTDRVGGIARDLQLKKRTDQLAKDIEKRLGGGGGQALLASAGSAPTYFVAAILTIFLLTFGPRIVRDGLAQIQNEDRRAAVTSTLRRALVRSRSAIFAMLAQASLVGLLVAGICRLLDLPAPITVGLLGALLGLIPFLGIGLAAFLVALLAAGFSSVTAAVAIFIGGLVLQTIEARWLRPRVDRSTMRIGPAVPWLAGLIGYSVYGIGGALYGAAYAVFALAVIDAAAVHRRAEEIAAAANTSS